MKKSRPEGSEASGQLWPSDIGSIAIDDFKSNPTSTILRLKRKFGVHVRYSIYMVYISDSRFFKIIAKLPLDVQQVIAHRMIGSSGTVISGDHFTDIIKKLLADKSDF